MDAGQPSLHLRIARLLTLAVRESGQSTAQIARKAELKWDTVRRTLDGKRAATIPEIVAILAAAGFPGDETLRLTLLLGEDFALDRVGSDVAKFLGEFLQQAPIEIVAQLGDDVDELRPRWANGTAKMLARTLSQHVAELNRRGDAIGDRIPHEPPRH